MGAGSVAHIAWASRDEDHLARQARLREAGMDVTEVKDRDYFRSIYLVEPRGVRFELATLSPGFTVDEDPEHLGEELRIPAMYADRREELERTITPLVHPRSRHGAAAAEITPGLHRILLAEGFVSAYLLVDDGELVLVDSGPPGSADAILAAVGAIGHEVSSLSTIVLTHAHLDHSGSAAALREATGARLLASWARVE